MIVTPMLLRMVGYLLDLCTSLDSYDALSLMTFISRI